MGMRGEGLCVVRMSNTCRATGELSVLWWGPTMGMRGEGLCVDHVAHTWWCWQLVSVAAY